MASPIQSPDLEIRHKSQQSHDSGAYIDWNSEDSGSSPTLDGNGDVTGEFVTVVAVEAGSGVSSGEEKDVSSTAVDGSDSFVTVLSIGATDSENEMKKLSFSVPGVGTDVNVTTEDGEERIEDVLVYRLPGERLGFGLKFEGGTKTAERVRRLFIQSCAPDSPASRARCTWGTLQEGDEVLEIDGVPVQNMTRIDCVRCLKESHVVIKLLVRHPAPNTNPYASDHTSKKKNKLGLIINDFTSHNMAFETGDILSPTKFQGDAPLVISAEMKKSPPPPPPIPPRKLPRKNPPNKDKALPTSIVVPPRGFGDGDSSSSKQATTRDEDPVVECDAPLQKAATSNNQFKRVAPPSASSEQSSPETARTSSKRFLGFDVAAVPPEAEVYLDLLAQEELNRLNESESDDTGSSISTVVDRLSSIPTTSNSSFSASSTPSTPTATSTPAIDLAKVLSPFEQLEREFASAGQLDDDVYNKYTSEDTTFMEFTSNISVDPATDFMSTKPSQADDDSLTLQPPISFQDAPLSYGDEKVITTLNNEDAESDLDSVSMSECKFEAIQNTKTDNFVSESVEKNIDQDDVVIIHSDVGISSTIEISSENNTICLSINDANAGYIDTNEKKESKTEEDVADCTSSQHEGFMEEVDLGDVQDSSVIDAPALPPKPAPRQESNSTSTRFRSGKKRPPPPPPPRSDRPLCPQPDNAITNAASIEEFSQDQPAQTEVSEKIEREEETAYVEEKIETTDAEEISEIEMTTSEDVFSSWEFNTNIMKNVLQSQIEVNVDTGMILNTELIPTSGKSLLELPEATLLEDDDSEDDVPEFAISAVMASEAFFPFHWSVVSHLDTIGEDEAEEEEEEDEGKDEEYDEEEEEEEEDTGKVKEGEVKEAESPEKVEEIIQTPDTPVEDRKEEEEEAKKNEMEEEKIEEKEKKIVEQEKKIEGNKKIVEAKEVIEINEEAETKALDKTEDAVEVREVVPASDPVADEANEVRASPPMVRREEEVVHVESAAVRDKEETEAAALLQLDEAFTTDTALLTHSATSSERPSEELREEEEPAPEIRTTGIVEEVSADEMTIPELTDDSPTLSADDRGSSLSSEEETQEEFSPAGQHEPLATEPPAPPTATASDSSTASHDTGVRGTMDALLALDSLTAAISNKTPPVHGYSQSSLSDTSLSPPPSFSRLPPDGHEFPPNYQEPNHFSVGVPAVIEMELPLEKNSPSCDEPNPKQQSEAPPLPASGPPPRKQSIGQEVEFLSSARKFSNSSASSGVEEVTVRSPVRWRKDEKSERSVRDKIAMFSNTQEGQSSVGPPLRRVSKFSSSEDVFYQDDTVDNASVTLPTGKLLSRSVLSVDKVGQHSPYSGRHPNDPVTNPILASNNLYKKTSPIYSSTSDVSSVASVTGIDSSSSPKSLEYTTRTQSYMDLPSSSSSAYSSCSPDSSLSSTASTYTLGYSSTLPRKLNQNRHSSTGTNVNSSSAENNQKQNGAPSLYRRTSFCGSTGNSNLHSRSQSLVDVGAIPSNKRNSIAGYKASAEDMRKASLNALIEQRRRGISKLRGLVIPEKVTEMTTNQAIIDLPEIKSRDSILAKPQIFNKDDPKSSPARHSSTGTNRWGTSIFQPYDKTGTNVNSSAPTNLSTLPWKSQTPVPNLPKYSPAFKRKSLSLYGVSSSASSVSSSLSSSREELRPLFDNTPHNNDQKSCPPPLPPMKPPRNATTTASSISKSTLVPCYSSVASPLLPHPEPPKSLESITSPTRSDLSFEFLSSNGSSPDLRMTTPTLTKDDLVLSSTMKNGTGKIMNGELYAKIPKGNTIHSEKSVLSSDVGRSAGEDDSDNDSAVSSSRSSISHGFSPPPSPLPDNTGHQSMGDSGQQHLMISPLPSTGSIPEKRPLRRTLSSETTASAASSTASTLTSGSQASCSSNGSSGSDSNKRVLKAQSVEAINRKNVLSSARYSSGRDLKVGSPLIKRKFEDEDETLEGKVADTRDEALLQKSGRYESADEIKSKNLLRYKVSHGDDGSTDVGMPNDPVHYRTSSTESMPDGVIKMAYLEVEENESVEIVTDVLENYSAASKGNTDDTAHTEDEEDEAELIPPRPVAPLPAPRRTFTPTQAGKLAQGNDNIQSEEGETSSAPGFEVIKDDDDDVFKYEKPNKIDVKNEEVSSGAKFNNDVPKEEEEEIIEVSKETSSAQEKWQYNYSADINAKSIRAPIVPPKPKPVQRRSSLKNNPLDVSNEAPDGSSHDSNLMDILTGKSGKQDHSMSRLRDRQKSIDSEVANRPISLAIEKETENDQVLLNGSKKSPSVGEQSTSPTSIGPNTRISSTVTRSVTNRRSVSVNDIKKAFEKAELALANSGRASNGNNVKMSSNGIPNNHMRVSSLDSTTSEDSMIPTMTHYGSASNLHREQYGSITSLASSSTSLISQQELQALIDEANQSIEESGGFCTPVHEVLVVILHREVIGGSVGITLAGGADYEAKEITVHKVLAGSLADRDGRIQKGDRILSINGRSMKNVTHKESLEILKAPRLEVVLVVSRSRSDSTGSAVEEVHTSMRSSLSSSSRPPRILEQLSETVADCQTEESQDDVARGPPVTITLAKDGAGLGFSLEGGKDSPTGDKPLTIKKIFTGGAAEKNGQLKAGDELLVVNGKDVTVMSRIEAWGLMKRLPDGNVSLTVRHKVDVKQ